MPGTIRRRCTEPTCTDWAAEGRSRCRAHQRGYPYSERQRMRKAVARWIHERGQWCPGYNRDGHYAEDLTAEHVTNRRDGGIGGALTVLCRSCNSARVNYERGQGH